MAINSFPPVVSFPLPSEKLFATREFICNYNYDVISGGGLHLQLLYLLGSWSRSRSHCGAKVRRSCIRDTWANCRQVGWIGAKLIQLGHFAWQSIDFNVQAQPGHLASCPHYRPVIIKSMPVSGTNQMSVNEPIGMFSSLLASFVFFWKRLLAKLALAWSRENRINYLWLNLGQESRQFHYTIYHIPKERPRELRTVMLKGIALNFYKRTNGYNFIYLIINS